MSPTQHNPYTLETVYTKPAENGYGKPLAYQRFEILKLFDFNSVLDVGSGACFLLDWLKENNIETDYLWLVPSYEAVDIRPQALALCNCQTYTQIPKNKVYDLVCLFGTVTYNLDYDNEKNKQTLVSLLQESIQASKKYLLFTVMKNEINHPVVIEANRFLYYTKQDVVNLLTDLKVAKYEIIENDNYDREEYFVVIHR